MSASIFSSIKPDPRFRLFLKCFILLQFKRRGYCKICSYKNKSTVCFTSVCLSFVIDQLKLQKNAESWLSLQDNETDSHIKGLHFMV